MNAENVYSGIPSELPEELFTTILSTKNLRIERIVSQGHCSAPGFWYDQEENEWVVVVKGNATIQFDGDPEPIELGPGAFLAIPAHTRHRVVSTSPTEKTIWLAVHYGEQLPAKCAGS